MQKQIKYVMFDFDNTLVKSLQYWNKVKYNILPKKYNKKPNKKINEHLVDTGNKVFIENFIKYYDIPASYDELHAFIDKSIRYCYSKKIKLIKGAISFLEYLKTKGYILCLASATDDDLLNVALDRFDLKKYFTYVFTEQSIGYSKPEKEFFSSIKQKLGAKAEQIFFFEDSFSSIKNAIQNDIKVCSVVHRYNKQHIKEIKGISVMTIVNYKNKKLKNIL